MVEANKLKIILTGTIYLIQRVGSLTVTLCLFSVCTLLVKCILAVDYERYKMNS